MVERYIFSSLRDFLYADLGKAALMGNAPRKCCLCGNWFFREQGDRAIYCERVAPGEETWKFYKRVYKKYDAWVIKGHMSRAH